MVNLFYFFPFFWLDPKETKGQDLGSHRSNRISTPKRNELAMLKQHFFSRSFQLF